LAGGRSIRTRAISPRASTVTWPGMAAGYPAR
jgi:hypothetical protein